MSNFFYDRIGPTSVARWITFLFQLVLQNLSSICVPDSFTFVKEVRKITFSSSFVFLCSFDISSLFTNVPLSETIEACADALYNDDSMASYFPCNILVELMQLATSSAKFNFNSHKRQSFSRSCKSNIQYAHNFTTPPLVNIFLTMPNVPFTTIETNFMGFIYILNIPRWFKANILKNVLLSIVLRFF